MADSTIRLTMEGHAIEVRPGLSLIQAWIGAGLPLTENVGCMGQGVCGSCRVLVRRAGERLAATALACETRGRRRHAGRLPRLLHGSPRRMPTTSTTSATAGQRSRKIDEVFPEAKHCRHCGGCDTRLPQGARGAARRQPGRGGPDRRGGARCSTNASCATSASPPAPSTSPQPSGPVRAPHDARRTRCARPT